MTIDIHYTAIVADVVENNYEIAWLALVLLPPWTLTESATDRSSMMITFVISKSVNIIAAS